MTPQEMSPSLIRLEAKLDQLTEAVAKLVLLEERQINQASRLTAAEKDIEELEKAQRTAEKKVDQLINRGVGMWMVICVLGAALFTVTLKLIK